MCLKIKERVPRRRRFGSIREQELLVLNDHCPLERALPEHAPLQTRAYAASLKRADKGTCEVTLLGTSLSRLSTSQPGVRLSPLAYRWQRQLSFSPEPHRAGLADDRQPDRRCRENLTDTT